MTLHDKILMIALSAFGLFAVPLVQGGDSQDEAIQSKILHAMRFMHGDVRRDALSAVKCKSGLSDDEFSAALVDFAKMILVTNPVPDGNWQALQMFAFSSLRHFGTTNALGFLEQEALHGRHSTVAFNQHAALVGFDMRFIDLSQRVVEHYDGTNAWPRGNVYRAMQASFKYPNEPGREVDDEKLARMKSFLRTQIQTETIYMPYLDSILCEIEPSYANSPEREEALRRALNDPSNLPLPRSDLETILAKIEAEKAAAKEREAAEALRKGQTPRIRLRRVTIGAGAVALLIGGYALLRCGRQHGK